MKQKVPCVKKRAENNKNIYLLIERFLCWTSFRLVFVVQTCKCYWVDQRIWKHCDLGRWAHL